MGSSPCAVSRSQPSACGLGGATTGRTRRRRGPDARTFALRHAAGVTKDFTYGANVPCTSVLVDKDFLMKHSANTLRQFIGRVARTGLAPFGVAQFEDDDFLPKMCGKRDDQEAQCMEETAKALLATGQYR